MRTIIVILVVLLLMLQIQVWRQYGRVAELERRVETQRDENRHLAARNDALDAEVADLKSGLDAVEERARSELGLIREGEEFYLVVEPEDLDPEDARALREFEARQDADDGSDSAQLPVSENSADSAILQTPEIRPKMVETRLDRDAAVAPGPRHAHGGPVGSGAIRVRPEDFRVVEDVGYGPSGDGEHLWLEIEKRGMNTVDVAARLARLAEVPLRSVGFGGLKDRNAVTRQPFSIQLPGREDPDWSTWSDEGMRIVSVSRHNRKIQRGRLAGNRFELVVRELEGDRAELEQRLRRIAELGVPQRFRRAALRRQQHRPGASSVPRRAEAQAFQGQARLLSVGRPQPDLQPGAGTAHP